MKIYVIDTETTGLMGIPYDMILEVGVASLDLTNGEIRNEYSEIVLPHAGFIKRYREDFGEPWIFKEGCMSPDELCNGKHIIEVREELIRLLRNKMITSYNTAFDFDKFLYKLPWILNCYTINAFDIADLATNCIKNNLSIDPANHLYTNTIRGRITKGLLENPDRRVRMRDAYEYFIGRPLDQTHRAIDDAIAEAEILKAILCR